MIFVFRHIISFVLVGWLAVSLSFFALRLLPGNAIESQLLQNGVSEEVIEQRQTLLGLNKPIWMQYFEYMGGLLHGNLGYSLIDSQPIADMIWRNLPSTVTLAAGAMILASVLGILGGIAEALTTNKTVINIIRLLINLSLSMPIYWTGTLAIFFLSDRLGLLPSTGSGRLSQLLMPISVLGFQSAGAIARLTQQSITHSSRQDFVRTAHAKGLPEYQVVTKHILRVGLLPVITVILLQTGYLLSGVVITENLFLRPGIGRLLLDRVLQQDYPAVQGIVILMAFIHISLTTLGDLIYPLFDPRVAIDA